MGSEERLAVNVLVLELSTMIVAIALALNAQSIGGRLTAGSALAFVVVNVVVIYMWWEYVALRLRHPLSST